MLVVVILAQKTLEMFLMSDPTVYVSTRTILKEEVEEAGRVILNDHKMNIGFAIAKVRIDADTGDQVSTFESPTAEQTFENYIRIEETLQPLNEPISFVNCGEDLFYEYDFNEV